MDDVAGIVLAGGRSRRMGRDKAAVILGERTLLQWAIEAVSAVAPHLIVVVAPEQQLPPVASDAAIEVVRDPIEGEGPLAGILAGLRATAAERAIVVACDQPFARPELLQLVLEHAREYPSAVPVVEGDPHPLFAAIRRDALPDLEAAFAAGVRRAMAVAELPGAALLGPEVWRAADPDGRSFIGVNDPVQLARAEAYLAAFELDEAD